MVSLATQSSPGTTPSGADGAVVARAVALSKEIDGRAVLRLVDLSVARGEFVGLIGANGAGKSTLLRVLATLLAPSSGRVELFGRAADRHAGSLRARLGFVGHQSMLYRDLSARENLHFFARLYGVASQGERVGDLLRLVGLLERGDSPVRTLSRGMVQRAAIARALVHSPELLLLDEPFSGLDAHASIAIESCLAELSARGTTILMADHDLERVGRLCSRTVLLREGRVAAGTRSMSGASATGATPSGREGAGS